MAADAAGEQRHPLVLRPGPVERVNADLEKVGRLDQLWQDPVAVKRRTGAVVGRRAVVVGDEAAPPQVPEPGAFLWWFAGDDPLRSLGLAGELELVIRPRQPADA